MPVIGDQVGLTLDRIVLGTDFTPASEKATKYAIGLSKRFASTLSLVNVVDLSIATISEYAMAGEIIDQLRNKSAERQKLLLKEVTVAGVRAATQTLEEYKPAAAIVRLANELHADLIVIGTHGRTGLSRAILGSCAEGVIHHATCPVLTIGPSAKPAPAAGLAFHTVVFATDFNSSAALEAAVALSFAEDSIGQIYLCHVLDKPNEDICETFDMEFKFGEALQKLIPRSAYDWCCPERVVETGEVAPSILQLAKKVGADLIVLGARHSGAWYTNLVEGTVGKVLLNAECPVMTVCAR